MLWAHRLLKYSISPLLSWHSVSLILSGSYVLPYSSSFRFIILACLLLAIKLVTLGGNFSSHPPLYPWSNCVPYVADAVSTVPVKAAPLSQPPSLGLTCCEDARVSSPPPVNLPCCWQVIFPPLWLCYLTTGQDFSEVSPHEYRLLSNTEPFRGLASTELWAPLSSTRPRPHWVPTPLGCWLFLRP